MLGTVSTFYDVDAVLIAVSFLTMIIKVRIIIVPINVHGLRSRLESLLEWPSPSPSLRSRPRLTSPPVEVVVIIVLLFIILYYNVYSLFFSTLFTACGGCRHKHPCRFKHFEIFTLVSYVLFLNFYISHDLRPNVSLYNSPQFNFTISFHPFRVSFLSTGILVLVWSHCLHHHDQHNHCLPSHSLFLNQGCCVPCWSSSWSPASSSCSFPRWASD